MNLHGIVSGHVGAVNPQVLVEVRVSAGSEVQPNGARTPIYATPGEFTGSIAGSVLTVTAVAAGKLLGRQIVAGADVASGTRIVRQLSGTAGGAGTYEVDRAQDVDEETMTTTLTVLAQVQPMTFRDIQQVDSLNLQGTRRSIYLNGSIDGLVRPDRKGGDLVLLPDGSVWLVALVLEQFPDWAKCAITLQNGT